MIKSWVQSLGLLVLRVSLGVMMLAGHGLGKLMNFPSMSQKFADPLGIGSYASLSLAVFAEFFCAVLLVLGIATRLSVIPLIITMIVALALYHGDDPWVKKELSAMYLAGFASLFICGGGGFSLDGLLWRFLKRSKGSSRGSKSSSKD